MSVRLAMAASNFSTSRRANWAHPYNPHLHYIRARQFQPPLSRTIAMMHDAHTTYDGSTPAHANSASMFNHNEPSFFEESFQYDGTPVDSDAGTYQQWSDLQYHNLNNFRPTSSTGTSFNSSFSSMNSSHTTDVDDTAIHKIDNSPVVPALSYHVDTSKYEHVDYEDYVMRSIDYEGSSPSSNETESTGPPTPTSPGVGSTPFRTFYNDAFLAPRRDSFATKIESAPLQCRPDVPLNNYASLTAQPSHVPLSVIFNEAQNPSNAYMTFANHPHAHGPPVQSALPYQGLPPTTLSQRATLESSNLSTTGAEPKLEQPFLDTTSEEDSDTDSDHGMELEASDRAVDEAHHRRDRDRYLLKMREKGLSYKEIKRRGRFTEAESTLRGRVRVMTKHKSERVRKPVWTENDIELLEEAVGIIVDCASTKDNHGRIPWKKIGDWMRENGSSYHFAGATCAKKWKTMIE